MKTSQFITCTFAALTAAVPVAVPAAEPVAVPAIIEARQFVGSTENEYSIGGCRDVIFFFARGSGEIGNMGSTVGPPTGRGLKEAFGDARVAVEGIDYGALLSTNFLPGGADYAGIAEMEALLNQATTRCPNSVLLVAGYSQGAALVHRAVEDRSAAVKAKIAGVVTYGDTRNLQDSRRIPNFPTEKTKIICNTGDLVCSGTLTITAAHLDYVRRVPEAVTFLVARARAAGA